MLERILLCPGLPTLPGVAMQVLELTRDPQVSLSKIAACVQNDPALATKVLKTINSSFYGLPSPCPSINRALGLLGLNTVKAIVLGFSLVDTAKKIGAEDKFDFEAYWRRAVYGAAGARAVALAVKRCDPEEAFLGGLLRDVGVLAAFAALKDQYGVIMGPPPDDHESTIAIETARLGCDHAQIGRLLAERWRLPPQLTEAIAWHHAPDRCSPANADLLRCVHLGDLSAAALTMKDSKRKLGAFITRCREWYGLDQPGARAVLENAAKGAAEMSKLLQLRTGAAPDMGAILSQAHEQMSQVQEAMQEEAAVLRRSNEDLSRRTITDPLTGAFNRAHFDEQLGILWASCGGASQPLGVLFIDADKFKSVNDTHGHQAGDAVLIEIARRLRECISGAGVVCRYGGEEFAVLLPRFSSESAAKAAELLRGAIQQSPIALPSGAQLPVTISVGVAACVPGRGEFADETALVKAADESVYAAKQQGRNRVCVHGRASGARQAPTAQRRVLVVDDDPMAIRLMTMLIGKCPGYTVECAKSGAEAVAACTKSPPDLVLCDMALPEMPGEQVIAKLAALPRRPGLIFGVSADPAQKDAAVRAGATGFVCKDDLCADTEAWLKAVEQKQTKLAA